MLNIVNLKGLHFIVIGPYHHRPICAVFMIIIILMARMMLLSEMMMIYIMMKCMLVCHEKPSLSLSIILYPASFPPVLFLKEVLVSENDLFLTLGSGTSSARNENLRPLLNTNTPLFSRRYGLRNHF